VRGQAASIGIFADSPAGPGLAAVVLDPAANPASRGPWSVRVRAFGPAGDALADRVLAAAVAWVDAGRPAPEDLRLTVVPPSVEVPPADAAAIVVEQEHCRVLIHPPNPTSGTLVG
jgi:protein-L-isoaspartate(D-aspartate) O-methyltransferase